MYCVIHREKDAERYDIKEELESFSTHEAAKAAISTYIDDVYFVNAVVPVSSINEFHFNVFDEHYIWFSIDETKAPKIWSSELFNNKHLHVEKFYIVKR